MQLDWFYRNAWVWLNDSGEILCSIFLNHVDKLNLRKYLESKKYYSHVIVGMKNSKNSKSNMRHHESSNIHKRHLEMHLRRYSDRQSVTLQLYNKFILAQSKNRALLIKAHECMKACTRQNMSFRGKTKEIRNFRQIINLVYAFSSKDNSMPQDHISPQIQN